MTPPRSGDGGVIAFRPTQSPRMSPAAVRLDGDDGEGYPEATKRSRNGTHR